MGGERSPPDKHFPPGSGVSPGGLEESERSGNGRTARDRRDRTRLVVEQGPITRLTLRDGAGLNLLTVEVLDELVATLERLAGAAPRALVLTGDGDRAFSAGAHLEEVASLDDAGVMRFAELGQRATTLLADFPAPVLAVVHGVAMGGGLELAIACDLRVATDDARLAYPAAALGILPTFGGTQRLPALVGPARARELLYLGTVVDGVTAAGWGLVNQAVPRVELDRAIAGWETRLLAQDGFALARMKACLRRVAMEDLTFEREAFALCLAGPSARQRIQDWLANRK